MIVDLLLRLTRFRLIAGWCALVALAATLSRIGGASPTTPTMVVLLALALAPPMMVLMLWPGVQPQTAAEVIRGDGRRR
jgi:hypothetical protein